MAAIEIRNWDTALAQRYVKAARELLPLEDRKESAERLSSISKQLDETLATASVSGANDLAEFNRLCGRVARRSAVGSRTS